MPGTLLKLWPDFEGNSKTASVFWIVRRFTDSHRQAGVQQSLGKQGSIMPNCDLRRQVASFWTSPIPSYSFTFIYWAWQHLAWNIPWDIWGQLSCLCPSQFLVHSLPPNWWGSRRNRKGLDGVQASFSNKNISVLSKLFAAHIPNITPYYLLWRKLTLSPKSAQKHS